MVTVTVAVDNRPQSLDLINDYAKSESPHASAGISSKSLGSISTTFLIISLQDSAVVHKARL